MSRSLICRRSVVCACFVGCLLALSFGLACPQSGGVLDPTVPPGNRPPHVIITDISTPSGDDYFAQQGDLVTISFTAEDGEDQALVRVFASFSPNPTPEQEILILTGFAVGPGAGSGAAAWDTTPIVPGSYYLFAEIDDGTYDPIAQTGNPAVRVTAAKPVAVAQPGTAPENGSPTIDIELPNSDAGLSNRGILTIRCRVKDPNSDEDTINITYYLDKDKDTSNDAVQPPLIVGTDVVSAGTTEPDEFTDPAIQYELEIDLNTVPIRIQTDEGGRPMPYYVRIRANDGKNIVDKYAVGAVRVLAAPSDVVDLLQIGSTAAGATWQGFDGFPDDPARGSRAGSAFTALGDMDGDGIDDFALAAQTASPYNEFAVGETYLIYGRNRRVDPDAENFQYAQGRYAGVISLNTVGSMVPFAPTDPRYETVFNIRGSVLPHPRVDQFGFGSMGIECLAALPDVTGDGHPELLVGSPFNDSVFDQEDDDPCDTCEFDTDTFAPINCYVPDTQGEVTGEVTDGIEGQLPPGLWNPVNIVLELDEIRLRQISQLQITFDGSLATEPDPPAAVNIDLDVRIEDSVAGPQGSISILTDDTGSFSGRAMLFNVGDLFPPAVGVGDLMPPSVYDGRFTLFIRPSLALDMEAIEVRVVGDRFAIDTDEHNIAFTYFDTYPNRRSDTASSGQSNPANPLALVDLEPVLPPMNRTRNVMNDGFFGTQTFGNGDGQLCAGTGVFQSCVGPDQDDLGNRESYQSGLVFVCGSDNLILPLNEQGNWTHGGRRVASLGSFGQPVYVAQGGGGLIGARFRGAYYRRDNVYDPESLFGYTVDTTPDISTNWGQVEVLLSAPGSGSNYNDPPIDGSAVFAGTYDHTGGLVNTAAFFDTGVAFNSVQSASLLISGTAQNVARLRVGLDEDSDGLPDPESSRVALFWSGASAPVETDGDPTLAYGDFFGDTVQFTDLEISLPTSALDSLRVGSGTIAIELLPDGVVEGSSVTITSAFFTGEALLQDTGTVVVLQGSNYTGNLEGAWCGLTTDGDAESDAERPMSWPSFSCDPDREGVRDPCSPAEFARFFGEQSGDSFGFAHHAGDINLDGVADIACGAPGSDNDPVNPDINCGVELAPLTDNGKTYVIFGTPSLGSGRPCAFSRMEIRGTHNDDQFGRVQGNAGDTNGDGEDDFFFAAEGYDSNGLYGMPSIGANAGFVGLLFGHNFSSGEYAIRAEQVGTDNYPGCKFVGGSPEARLGGGSPAHTTRVASARGQHGVSSAGDFNLDGYEDILITAPGQEWPGAFLAFTANVPAGSSVRVNGNSFVFPTTMTPAVAQAHLLAEMGKIAPEVLNTASMTSRLEYPAPLPDDPTISFLARRPGSFSVTTTVPGSITVTTFVRQGVAYLVFGSESLLNNKTFVLPDDLNRRNLSGKRVLKGAVFVSGYEKNTVGDTTPDEAPIEVVSVVGDVDNDGYVDIMLGAPQADFINILSPSAQRRQASGEAYLIYGNEYGLNKGSAP